jgi:hypothetical protein
LALDTIRGLAVLVLFLAPIVLPLTPLVLLALLVAM